MAGLCWPPAAPQSRGPGGRAPPTAIAFLAIPLIYFETPARPTSPSTFPGGRWGRPAAVPHTAPRPVPVPYTLVPLPPALVLPGYSARAPGLCPEQRVPGSSAVPSSVCPSSGPTPSGKLRAALGQAAPRIHGLLLHEWLSSAVALWPGLCHRGGWWSGSWYGWGSASQCCLCRVCSFCLGIGGGWLVVFLNKCTKERLGLLSWSVG